MPSRRQNRQKAFERAPLGQAQPGALSRTPTDPAQRDPNFRSAFRSRNDSPFVTLPDGRTGTIVDLEAFERMQRQNAQRFQQELERKRNLIRLQSQAQLQQAVPTTASTASAPSADVPNNVFTNPQGLTNPFAAQSPEETPSGPDLPVPTPGADSIPGVTEQAETPTFFPGEQNLPGFEQQGFVDSLINDNPLARLQQLDPSRQNAAAFLTLGVGGPIFSNVARAGTIAKAGKGVPANAKAARSFENFFSQPLNAKNTVTVTDPQTGQRVTKPLAQVAATSKNHFKTLATGVNTVVKGLATVALLTLGGENFGRFIVNEEASQGAGMAAWTARQADDYEAYQAARDIQDEALDFDPGIIPIKNVADSIQKYIDIVKRSNAITDKVVENKFIAKQLNESPDETFIRERRQEEESFKAVADYNDQLRREYLEFEADFRKRARAEKRAEDKQFMLEQAAFWAEQRRLRAEEEAKERERVAKFWADYKKMQQKLSDQNQPSRLVFGLL